MNIHYNLFDHISHPNSVIVISLWSTSNFYSCICLCLFYLIHHLKSTVCMNNLGHQLIIQFIYPSTYIIFTIPDLNSF